MLFLKSLILGDQYCTNNKKCLRPDLMSALMCLSQGADRNIKFPLAHVPTFCCLWYMLSLNVNHTLPPYFTS